MKENNNNNEEKCVLYMNLKQYDYLLLVLTGLCEIEKKVPKGFKTKNSDTLLELLESVKEIRFNK